MRSEDAVSAADADGGPVWRLASSPVTFVHRALLANYFGARSQGWQGGMLRERKDRGLLSTVHNMIYCASCTNVWVRTASVPAYGSSLFCETHDEVFCLR